MPARPPSPAAHPSRRTLLRSGAAVLGSAALGGCLDALDGDEGPAGPATPIEGVPAGARLVFHVDVAALLDDEVLRAEVNALLEDAERMTDFEALTVESSLDRIERAVGLDPRGLQTLTLFAGYEPDAPAALSFAADWSESALRDALASYGGEPTTGTHGGRTVYEFDDGAVGVLGEGSYVAGQRPGVEAAIDVVTGEADAVGGRVRDGFEAAPAGPIRFAFDAPDDLESATRTDASDPIDPEAAASLTHGYGGYVLDGDERRASLTLETSSADVAARLADGLRDAFEAARGDLDAPTVGSTPAVNAAVDEVLASVEIEADGAAVVLTVGRGELVVPLVATAVLASFVLGLGNQAGPVTPVATFDFDYDSDVGVVEITHAGGDSIGADGLTLRGEGFAARPDADMTSPGRWVGSTSGSVDGRPAVVAGDSVTVGVESDYAIRLVWESPDGVTSTELAFDRGPDA